MEDEYNYTALADDTVTLESPSGEAQRLNFDMNTEVLDASESAQDSGDQMEDYCEKEVVLDSDDEGREQNEARNLVNGKCFPAIGRFSGRNGIGMLNRLQVPTGHFRRLNNKFGEHVFLHHNAARRDRRDEESNAGRSCLFNENLFQEHPVVMDSEASMSSPDQRTISTNAKEYHVDPEYESMVKDKLMEKPLDEKKLSLHESKPIEMGKNENYSCELTELNYVVSPVPAESHMKALEFVDHYLSVTDLGSYKDVDSRKTIRIKSPPSLRSKGFQCLARRVNPGCTASKSMTFDWDENQIESKPWIFGFECDKFRNLSVNQESDNVNLQKEISSVQSKEKLPQNTLSTKDSDTNSLNSTEIEKVGSNSETRIAYDSMELDEQFNAGLFLDIGMDTQMAAEAMEALVQAPPMFDACSTHQVSDDTPLASSNTLNEESKPNYVAKLEEAFAGWRCRQKRSKCVKISTVQDKNISISAATRPAVAQLPVSENLITEKPMTRKNLDSRNPEDMRISKCGGATEITVQQPAYGFTERDSLKEFGKVHCSYGRRLKQTIEGIKPDSHPKRRKKISGHDDVRQIGAGGTCLKLNYDSSFRMRSDTEKREENSDLDVADKAIPMLNVWKFPKQKRSRQFAPHHSVKSGKQSSPCTAVENNVEKYPIVNEEANNRVAKLLVYARQHKFPLEREQLGSSLKLAGDFSSPSVNASAILDREVQASIEFDQAKPSMQCSKLDDGKPLVVNTPGNMKSDIFSNGHSMTSQVFEVSDKSKQTFNHLSRSPLMKELMRLGHMQSLPDFLPKDSRRRRAMEKVCILFSQNLETSILKQQKKIVARLGFSIASCCSDATHFVTDRFLRTRNMLEAIALGKSVVTHLWLDSCEQAGYVIDEKSYILRDEKKEKEIGFNMAVSLTRASQHPLLEGRRVIVTPNVKPGIEVINSLVKAVHGQAVPSIMNSKMKDKVIPDDLLVVSCKEDYTICLPFLEKGASIYDSELLLNGIVTQQLEYERFQLFRDFVKTSTCYSIL
ncbi:hypothetical protein CDL12_01200 [Handroanthus impetiginosus]|uniref:BRCT domain-containing protein n=1 Tax=Handroanthus impetiginosus TaxID=429701 RepID=A0A2G9I8I3_9LAMI|nr:hypothetical protein CDL12_01200 [Handroanthus impetiginosus]